MVELNRAVAVTMAFGPAAGLELVDSLVDEPALRGYHLLPSVRGDVLVRLGRPAEARAEFIRAADLCENAAERELLLSRALGCDAGRSGERLAQEGRGARDVGVGQLAEERLGQLAAESLDLGGGVAARGGDVDEVGATVGLVLAPRDIAGLLEALERASRVAAVDGEAARERILGRSRRRRWRAASAAGPRCG